MSPGQTMVGFSVSFTATLKLHAALLPLVSVTVQVTTVVPLENVEPLGGTQTTVWPAQLSAPRGVKNGRASWRVNVYVEWVMASGQTKVGFSVSFTATLKLHAALLPLVSVTVQVTTVV